VPRNAERRRSVPTLVEGSDGELTARNARHGDLHSSEVWPDDANGGRKWALRGSHVLGPVVIRHQARTRPFLAIRICALASQETIVGMFEDRDPR
jgi:hypothetical protein